MFETVKFEVIVITLPLARPYPCFACLGERRKSTFCRPVPNNLGLIFEKDL